MLGSKVSLRERLPREIPDIDVVLLIANGERDARAVWRQTRLVVDARRRRDRRLLPLAVDPHERSRCLRAPPARRRACRAATRRSWPRRPPPSTRRRRPAPDRRASRVSPDRTARRAACRTPHTTDVRSGTYSAWLPRVSVLCWPVFRSRTATCAVAAAFRAVMVNSTPRPPGSTDGYQWFGSPFAGSGVVNTAGSPPAADTRNSPVVVSVVANTMLLSSPQLAPRDMALDLANRDGRSARDRHFLEGGAVEEPNPLAVGREERLARVGNAGAAGEPRGDRSRARSTARLPARPPR